jgi:prepilin-type processing-associated H-X9-DG protein
MFCEVRTITSEKPFYGTEVKQDNICKPQAYTTALSSRHNQGSILTFMDGHAGYFKYTYLCKDAGSKAADAGVADVSWAWDGTPVP